ncbi:MAG: DUF952 domain-containing protein [Caldilineaceae bacterium]
MIYHMLPAALWQQQAADQPYCASTVASEGFMHCTGEPELLLWVANRFYRAIPGDFVILGLDPALVQAEVRWEKADGRYFPHIYGPLNLDAVVQVYPFPRDAEGKFLPFLS